MIDFSSNGGQWVLRDNLFVPQPHFDPILLPYFYTQKVIAVKCVTRHNYFKVGWIWQALSIDPIGGVGTRTKARRLINGKQLIIFPVLTEIYRLTLDIFDYVACDISVWEFTPNTPYTEMDLLELLAIS